MRKGNKMELIADAPEMVELSKQYSNINAHIEHKKYDCRSTWEIDYINNLKCSVKINYEKTTKFYDSMYIMTTGELLNYLILQKRITNAELSKIIGVSPSSIGRWVNDVTNITDDNLKKLASYFNVSINHLKGVDCMPNHEQEIRNKEELDIAKEFVKNHGVSNLEKEILGLCGYYLIDPYTNSDYYNCEPIKKTVYENQAICKNVWISWKYEISMFSEFPKKMAIVNINELKNLECICWNDNNQLKYLEEIKNIAQYVDYDKLKVLIEDRKSMLAFNFEKSLESIK